LIVEDADQVAVTLEVEPDLFGRLANGRSEQIPITRLVATTRERHVARPRVAQALGPTNEEHFGAVVTFSEDGGDGRRPAARRDAVELTFERR
jgi:hypothetical protein